MQVPCPPQSGTRGEVAGQLLQPPGPSEVGRAPCQLGAARDRDLAESGGSVEGEGEVAGEGAPQDFVGDALHLVRPGRLGAGHGVVGFGEAHPGAVLAGHGVRICADPFAHQVEPVERAGQRVGGAGRPQVGQGRQAEFVHERDEPLGDRGVVGRPPSVQQSRRGLVGGVQVADGVRPLAQRLEGSRFLVAGATGCPTFVHPGKGNLPGNGHGVSQAGNQEREHLRVGEDRRYHHGDLRRHLIAAARVEVEEHGVENVVLTRLAQTCGVSVAAPYRHFASKEALLSEVATGGFAELGAVLTHASRGQGAPRDRLLDAGVAYVRFAMAHPHLFRLMFNTESHAGVGEEGPAALGVLVSLVQACDLSVPVPVAVRASWAQVHGYASLCVGAMSSFRGATDQSIRTDMAALLDGVLAKD